MKKIITIIGILLILITAIITIKYLKSKDENKTNNQSTESKPILETGEIKTTPSLEDEIETNTIWCGTLQLIWNDLKNDIAKKDIVFEPQLKIAENLNKETFTTNDISDKYYYKKIGIPSIALKQEIEKAIKDKFNETSDILDDFNWEGKTKEDYFLYTMLKKEFQFEKEFEEFDNEKFKNEDNIKYFGIKKDSNEEIRKQVRVLYYNSDNDFAIKLLTKQEDEVIFCKNPEGRTFNEMYQNIEQKEKNFDGNKNIEEGEIVKVPKIKIKEKSEFEEIENKIFLFSNGDKYFIEKALQTIEFELDKTGGKIKSEAGMMIMKATAIVPDEKREFVVNDTFAMFLKENGKDKPYFACKVSDMSKFQ